jgi:hypothetical protein
MNRRRLLLIAAVWLATVVIASSATWAVISATGTRVGQSIPLSAPPSVASNPTPAPSTASATPNATPTKAATTPTTAKPSHSRPTSDPSQEQTVTGSWSGEAGTVTASCTGSVVSLVSAVPAVGYRAQVDGGGSRPLEVEFESSAGEDHEAHLKVSCADGKPVFRRD